MYSYVERQRQWDTWGPGIGIHNLAVKKRDGKKAKSDPKPVKVATAFWVKVKEKITDMNDDPAIREKVESELKPNDKAIQADTPASDWWTW